ncbi:nuclear transport factor 2 family protein [Chitinophaga sp. MM2321]|uniref:nuclear transport factor 2 family protein n=1 Tax=Chitinophaga sp. MM2321 TaxID=3137178 RepID=UPI0032D591CE
MKQLTTAEVIDLFNKAFQIHDATLLNELIDENCVMEGADNLITTGFTECYKFWETLINTHNTQFRPEKIVVLGEKATVQWEFLWGDNLENSTRGINLMTISNSKITEAIGYVKGNLS